METPTFIENYQTEEFELCDNIIERLEYYLENRQNSVMVGSETNDGQTQRVDYSINFTALEDSLNVKIFDVLNKYVKEYSNKYTGFAQNPCMSRSIKVQKTPPKGGFHAWHSEHTSVNNCSYRNLTWTLYLNDVENGGETEFLEYGIKVKPKKGLLCFFPASWTHVHRGNPIYDGVKYIATGWYYLT